jgi:hypothetical protein
VTGVSRPFQTLKLQMAAEAIPMAEAIRPE